jgi:NAD(P)H-nitrite reductase large subunit/rubredoxin
MEYTCPVCGYIYEEASENQKFEDLSDSWVCPICGMDKGTFTSPSLNMPSKETVAVEKDGKRIVVIGSGISGMNFAKLHLKAFPHNKVTVITREREWYYSRPYLSHGFSDVNVEKKLLLQRYSEIEAEGIEVVSSAEVSHIDRSNKAIIIKLHDKTEVTKDYDSLVFATGSRAFVPPPMAKFRDNFLVLNTLDDLEYLKAKRASISLNKTPRWAIIGGGLIGCEVASDLNKAGDQVDLFHRGDRLMERQLSESKSKELENLFLLKGIRVKLNFNTEDITHKDDIYYINNLSSKFDVIILATGFSPRINLAKDAGLDCNRGICTNKFFQTTDLSIYAVGDVAEVEGTIYPFVPPIMDQVHWLAENINVQNEQPAPIPKEYPVIYKIHDFEVE